MRVLIVKLTSLGDLVHLFPALTEAARARPEVEFDWAVDTSLDGIPGLHPAVAQVFGIPLRQGRRSSFMRLPGHERRALRDAFRSRAYDVVIDAQGLLKSVWVARWAGAPVAGFDWSSAREPVATLWYSRRFAVDVGLHAADRLRHLFGRCLDYPVSEPVSPSGIEAPTVDSDGSSQRHVLLLHGSAWATKLWPEVHWRALAEELDDRPVRLTYGNDTEARRAERIAAGLAHVEVMPRMDFPELVALLRGAAGVVGVDSGLLHLGAAVGVPVVGLYGATDPGLTGPYGLRRDLVQSNLPCAPCRSRRCRLQHGGPDQPGWPPCMDVLKPSEVAGRLRVQMEQLA